jgi:pilus assembly protein TadC
MEKVQEFGLKVQTFILGLNPLYVYIAAMVFGVAFVIMIGVLMNNFIKSGQAAKLYGNTVGKAIDSAEKSMHTTRIKAFNYEELDKYIHRKGIVYIFNGHLNPIGYMLVRLVFAFGFMIFGLTVNTAVGIVCLPVGYFATDWIFNESNKSDNRKMLDDIKNIYDTLRIQTKAGVYITSVITDCYLVVQNKRLKSALLKLTSDIIAKNDIDNALDEFKSQFENEYIDNLVIIVKQSMKTGQAAKMFEDIRQQITDIERAMIEKEKMDIGTKITIVQILLYLGIIAVSIYVCVVALSSSSILS